MEKIDVVSTNMVSVGPVKASVLSGSDCDYLRDSEPVTPGVQKVALNTSGLETTVVSLCVETTHFLQLKLQRLGSDPH